MPQSDGYVSPDYLRKTAELAWRLKERTYDLLALAPGDHALDVGCGVGIDTVALAQRVGPSGRMVGLDVDDEMVNQADALARQQGVADWTSHQVGSCLGLPFADGAFAAVRAERLFQVLPASVDPQQVLAEIVRVTTPGGRIVLADTDWATASVDFDDLDLERRLMAFFARTMRPNGVAGRQLYRWLRLAGLKEVAVEVIPMVHHDYTLTPFGDWLVKEATAHGVASQDQMTHWKQTLQQRNEEGLFYACANMVVVSGRKG
ncbi:MAG: hypothetical protein COX57_03615 [Alphaproteobacteria bacterium CG_4_10_14_0_2_um_filter_63_37]|nr:MAG: hypothetical protein AUJ55_11385 [Proteobacteria bacterium CG1_02_64_396]PJA25385.1 MAG: hypothetical protein COX57_03615 [Alphaproteobacteria bacterium CG_4_10_14_0_2_um_filter_63_37]